MTSRTADVFGVSVLAAALVAAIAWPVLQAPSERIFGMEIVGRHHDPFTVMQQFSRPIGLGIYVQPFTDVPGTLLARQVGAVAGYTWLVLLTFPLSAAAAFLLARYLALSRATSAFAALAFAFSPFHLAHAAYHPHIAQTQWVPLYLLALWRSLDRSTPARIGLLAAPVAGVALSNFYGGFIAAVVTPAAVAAHWFYVSRRHAQSVHRLAITSLSLAIVAAAGALYALYAAHDVVGNPAAFAFAREDLFRYSAKWWSYLVPPFEHPWLGRAATAIWRDAGVHEGLLEQQVSLGWGVVVLGLVAGFGWVFRDRRTPSLAAVPVLATVAVVALICSLSPERHVGRFTFMRPAAFLYELAPMFRAYARFGVVVQLMAALLAAIGAERLWRADTWRARFACAALVVVAAGEYAVRPNAMWRDVLPTTAHRWVARQPARLRVLDCAPLTPESASVGWLADHRISLSREGFEDCTEPNLADKLSAAGYTHVLLRRNEAESRWRASRRTLENLQRAAHFADADVFAIATPAPLVYTAEMKTFYPREYDATSTWRWMGPEASWRIVNGSHRVVVATVDVEMSAFQRPRSVTLLLDGRRVQTLTIGQERRLNRIGPLALQPGDHELAFQPADPPTVADLHLNNGDRRPLSFGIGAWHWTVEEECPQP